MNEYEKTGLRAMMKLAARRGVSVTEIEAEMRSAIDAAWEDESTPETRRAVFPDGKPSPAEFVGKISAGLMG